MARPRAPEESLDSELLAAIARHDQKACAVFYRRHLPRTVGYLMRETRDPELAADLSAEVFASVIVSARRCKSQTDTATPWVIAIARNVLANSRRRGRVQDRMRRRLAIEPLELDDDDLERTASLAAEETGPVVDLVEALPYRRTPRRQGTRALRAVLQRDRGVAAVLRDGGPQTSQPGPRPDPRDAGGGFVSDCYDRLQDQLMRATARPLPRARLGSAVLGRLRHDLFAIGTALAIAAAVAAIFVGLRPSASHIERLPARHGLAVVHNHLNGALPALGGGVVCDTKLQPARADRTWPAPYYCRTTGSVGLTPRLQPSGTVTVNEEPPLGEVFSIDVTGLPSSPRGGDYAVWLLSGKHNPALDYSLISGRRPAFVGIVTPPVGAGGVLRAQGSIPTLSEAQATGSYLFVITRQAHPSSTSLGRIVLAGWVAI